MNYSILKVQLSNFTKSVSKFRPIKSSWIIILVDFPLGPVKFIQSLCTEKRFRITNSPIISPPCKFLQNETSGETSSDRKDFDLIRFNAFLNGYGWRLSLGQEKTGNARVATEATDLPPLSSHLFERMRFFLLPFYSRVHRLNRWTSGTK